MISIHQYLSSFRLDRFRQFELVHPSRTNGVLFSLSSRHGLMCANVFAHRVLIHSNYKFNQRKSFEQLNECLQYLTIIKIIAWNNSFLLGGFKWGFENFRLVAARRSTFNCIRWRFNDKSNKSSESFAGSLFSPIAFFLFAFCVWGVWLSALAQPYL